MSGPVLGVVVGGILTTKAGGYSSVKGQKMQCYFGCVSVLAALPMPFIGDVNKFPKTNRDAWIFGALLWLVLFCGGFVLPQITGMLMESVGKYQKTSANSVANLAYNLFGYLPAPGLYGIIATATGGQ